MRTLRLTGLLVLAAFAVMAAELKGTVSCGGKQAEKCRKWGDFVAMRDPVILPGTAKKR